MEEKAAEPPANLPKPMNDRVAVLLDHPEGVTRGGILLPDNVQAPPTVGTVVSVGPGGRLESSNDRAWMMLKVGDRVWIGKYSGTDVEFEGKTYRYVHENDVIAVLRPPQQGA